MAGKILVVWEQGRNLGHLSRITAIADILIAHGYEVIFAVPDWVLATGQMDRYQCAHLPVPAYAGRTPVKPQSHADILLNLGFGDPAALVQMVSMWLRFLEEIKPESVILDYAHTAQLAVYVSQLPAVQISNGFDVPPPHCPIFAINARGPYLEATNRVKVQEIARALEALGNNLKCQRSLNLAEYLEYPFKIWDCIPETDPYGPRSKGLVVGPLGEPPKVSDAAWPLDLDTSKRKVFGYLRGMLGNEELLDALLLHQCSGIVVWPDAPPAALEKFARTEVRVLNTPVDLSHLLPTADFVVSYGAVALVTRTLLAGKPQLVATADAEKYLIARKVALLGAGVVWRPSIGTASKAVEHLLSSERFVLAAQSLANRYARSEWLTQQCQSLQVHLVEPRIIEYLLSQVQRAGNESLREK